MAGKPSTLNKKLLVGGAIASIVIGGGAYYFYHRSKTPDDFDDQPPPAAASVVEEDKEDKIDAQGLKTRGNKYFKAGRYEKAIGCYTEAIELCGEEQLEDMSKLYQNRAAANEQLKDWKAVVEDCTRAVELDPKYSKAIYRRAKAYEALDQKLNCLEDVTAVCYLDNFQNQPCMILADRILKGVGKELAADYYQKRPRALPSSTSIKSYLDSFNKDVFAVPVDVEVAAQDAVYLDIVKDMKNKQYDNIVDMCDKVIIARSKYQRRAILLRGTIKSLMSEVESAIEDFDRIIDPPDEDENDEVEVDDEVLDKLQVDALIKRASLKMQQADDVGCYADLSKAIDIDEKNANIYHSRGQLYFLTERLEEAKIDFNKAIALDSTFVAPRIQLGYCLCKIAMQMMSVDMMREANDVLEETCRLFPQSSDAFSLWGQLLQDQQRLDEAMEKLEKAISLSPTTSTTYVYKALLLLQWKQDLEGANKLIRKAIELDEKCDFAYETLATLEVQRGNNDEAIRLFQRSLQLVRTEAEMANTFSLLEAAKAQAKVTKQYGIVLPQNPMMM